jgi:serine/threonine protein kinase
MQLVKDGDVTELTGMEMPDASSADDGDRLALDMAAAWARGERRPVEYYLDRHPKLQDSPGEVARLIYEEVCLRAELGEEVRAEELVRSFPGWARELRVMLDCHRLVRARLAPPEFPTVGETLGDFELLAELGRGAQGRVYLAAQPRLADRLVVLKVSLREDREYLSLARLQHTNIIPLYGVHDFPARRLQALCQPYFGGATLALLLDLLRPVPVALRTGRLLVEALDRVGRKSPLPLPARGPRTFLARASYTEAICWIGACLAEALQYAHEQGLVHLDLKPANVLLAADGQPLLLDFHLARRPIAVGQAVPEGMGGTPQYMSPEQRAAFDAAANRLPMPAAVDHCADVFALGRLLYCALSGAELGLGLPLPPLHRCNPQISVGLSDIVRCCMAHDPDDRYRDAAALAADLRFHLTDRPLRGVANRSLIERWGKWRRRQPYALLGVGLLLAVGATGATVGTTLLELQRDRQVRPAEASEAPAFQQARSTVRPACSAMTNRLPAQPRHPFPESARGRGSSLRVDG